MVTQVIRDIEERLLVCYFIINIEDGSASLKSSKKLVTATPDN